MKYFIVQEEFEYSIYKVSDSLIEDFKVKMEKSILIEARSIQEALIKFGKLEKSGDFQLNPELKKVKENVTLDAAEVNDTRRHSRLKVK